MKSTRRATHNDGGATVSRRGLFGPSGGRQLPAARQKRASIVAATRRADHVVMSILPLEGLVVGVTADRRWQEQAALLERRGASVMRL